MTSQPPIPVVRHRRPVVGMSAILLPHLPDSSIDWVAFEGHVSRTVAAGLTPAVNMDTGFVQLLDDRTKTEVLDRTAAIATGGFVAGAYVADGPGDAFAGPAYVAAATAIAERGGTPVIFPTYGLNEQPEDQWVDSYAWLGTELDRFIGFELGDMFVPYGRIVSLDAYRGLLDISACVGAKHSSLSRTLEWQRLALRDELRPDFQVLTGNDLAIDMVMYGSDYLLGLSTFAPEAFAARDAMWAAGDLGFYELNDLLQYLGFFTFRDPVPGYRHDAAMFLALRGWASSDTIPEAAPRRPDSDREVLADISRRLDILVRSHSTEGSP